MSGSGFHRDLSQQTPNLPNNMPDKQTTNEKRNTDKKSNCKVFKYLKYYKM